MDENIDTSKLTPADLDEVDTLMKGDRLTLGFLPAEALQEYLAKGWVIGAKDIRGRLLGYLLYGSNAKRFRITHLCVSGEYRGKGIAKHLLQTLKDSATTQTFITLNCRRDFPANGMWPKLGFVAIRDRRSRSAASHTLTTWHLDLRPANQMDLGLSQAITSNDTLDVVMDAQVFFDLIEEDGGIASEPSQALLSDFLVDSLNLWITDELLNEIDRNKDPERRQASRERAQEFPQVKHSTPAVDEYVSRLREILPYSKPSDESDIRQLAKAASSDVGVFVTRDEVLLKKAKSIEAITNLQMLSPVALIIQIYELLKGDGYEPDRVSGLNLGWHRLTSTYLAGLPLESFLNEGERLGKFKGKFNSLVARPEDYDSELLKAGDNVSAIRILDSSQPEIVKVQLARVSASNDKSLISGFLIADAIAKAVSSARDMVSVPVSAVTPSLVPDLLNMGFTRCNDEFVRFCFSRCIDREGVLDRIAQLSPESRGQYQDITDLELEQYCSPLSLAEGQEHFLIPVRPGYALSLMDRYQSSVDLFGGDPNTLLRWDNVYYRAKSRHHILKPPARILWYVSGKGHMQIIAVSHLDEVVIGPPDELLSRFRRFGVLGRGELYKMSKGDKSRELMALKFSRTSTFRSRVPLQEIRQVYEEEGAGFNPISVSRMSRETFQKLFQLGFPPS